MIEIKGLRKKFKDTEAVRGISFKVNKGEVLGLLGENGAGKTTTLRMLATMLRPSEGTAAINGRDILLEPDLVRREIGILFGGEIGLYDRLTARENIEYFGLLNNMSRYEINKRIEYLTDILEMGEYIDKRVGKFSKGMKQKVAIGRCVVHNPPVMLFDEPTSGLDVTAARVVHQFIKSCSEENKTVIFSSHSMAEVEKLCDRVVIIHKGRIVEEGDLQTLKAKYDKDVEDLFVELVGDNNES